VLGFLAYAYIFVGIAIVGGPESTGSANISSSNMIADYSSISPLGTGLLFRCASGLGPTGNDNTELGGLLFGNTMISSGTCNGPVMQHRGASIGNLIGVINVFLCSALTTNNEGVYTCMMMNSSMVDENVRVGVYLSSRSEFSFGIRTICCIYTIKKQLFKLMDEFPGRLIQQILLNCPIANLHRM